MDVELRNRIIGFIGGGLVILGLLPQLIKIIHNKSSKNVSQVTYFTMFLANGLWSVYGILNHDLQVTTTNILANILTVLIIIASFYYSENETEVGVESIV